MPKKWAHGKDITYEEFIKKTGNRGYSAYRRYQYWGLANPATGANITPTSRTYTKPGQYRELASRDAKATGTPIKNYNIDKLPKRQVEPPRNIASTRVRASVTRIPSVGGVLGVIPKPRKRRKFKKIDLKKLLKGL